MRGALDGRLTVLAVGMAVFTILSTRNPAHKEKSYLMDEETPVKTLWSFVSKSQKNIRAKWIYTASKSKILAVPFIVLNSFECIRKCFTWTDACDLPMIHFIQIKRTKYAIIAWHFFNADQGKSVTLHIRARKSCLLVALQLGWT